MDARIYDISGLNKRKLNLYLESREEERQGVGHEDRY